MEVIPQSSSQDSENVDLEQTHSLSLPFRESTRGKKSRINYVGSVNVRRKLAKTIYWNKFVCLSCGKEFSVAKPAFNLSCPHCSNSEKSNLRRESCCPRLCHTKVPVSLVGETRQVVYGLQTSREDSRALIASFIDWSEQYKATCYFAPKINKHSLTGELLLRRSEIQICQKFFFFVFATSSNTIYQPNKPSRSPMDVVLPGRGISFRIFNSCTC
jgi:predicted RNA-binding Zn-ribbon protein involved in translation (DUF1610 family)